MWWNNIALWGWLGRPEGVMTGDAGSGGVLELGEGKNVAAGTSNQFTLTPLILYPCINYSKDVAPENKVPLNG